MAPPRKFDYGVLLELRETHPEWHDADYAYELKRLIRLDGKTPPEITEVTVRRAFWNLKQRGELPDLGDRREGTLYPELIHWPDIQNIHQMATTLRKLRWIARLRRGIEFTGKTAAKDIRQAQEFESRLRAERRVITYSHAKGFGERPARAHELNPDGTLIEIVEAPSGGWEHYRRRLPAGA
jgi:hypothetical protein